MNCLTADKFIHLRREREGEERQNRSMELISMNNSGYKKAAVKGFDDFS